MAENVTTINNATAGADNGANQATENLNRAGHSDNGSGNQPQTQAQPAKTYSEDEFQAEVDKRVQQALQTAREKWNAGLEERLKNERDEGARLAKMTAEERAKEEQQKQMAQFEEERKQFMREKLELETTKLLSEKNLPVEFASLLAGKDAEETKSGIEAFEKAWSDALQKQVDKRMKGTVPSAGSNTQSNDPFLVGFSKK